MTWSTRSKSTLPGSPRTHGPLRLGRLCRICPEEAIFERRAIEAADDGVHLFRIGGIDECEALRLLCFGVANYFDCVRNQGLGTQPALDIVRCDPDGQISKKDRKTHSGVIFDSMGRGFASREIHGSNLMLPHSSKAVNGNRSPKRRFGKAQDKLESRANQVGRRLLGDSLQCLKIYAEVGYLLGGRRGSGSNHFSGKEVIDGAVD